MANRCNEAECCYFGQIAPSSCGCWSEASAVPTSEGLRKLIRQSRYWRGEDMSAAERERWRSDPEAWLEKRGEVMLCIERALHQAASPSPQQRRAALKRMVEADEEMGLPDEPVPLSPNVLASPSPTPGTEREQIVAWLNDCADKCSDTSAGQTSALIYRGLAVSIEGGAHNRALPPPTPGTELRQALEPFAEAADAVEHKSDDEISHGLGRIRMRFLRAVRKAVAATDPRVEGGGA